MAPKRNNPGPQQVKYSGTEEYRRAEFADCHFACAVRGLGVDNAMGHVRL